MFHVKQRKSITPSMSASRFSPAWSITSHPRRSWPSFSKDRRPWPSPARPLAARSQPKPHRARFGGDCGLMVGRNLIHRIGQRPKARLGRSASSSPIRRHSNTAARSIAGYWSKVRHEHGAAHAPPRFGSALGVGNVEQRLLAVPARHQFGQQIAKHLIGGIGIERATINLGATANFSRLALERASYREER